METKRLYLIAKTMVVVLFFTLVFRGVNVFAASIVYSFPPCSSGTCNITYPNNMVNSLSSSFSKQFPDVAKTASGNPQYKITSDGTTKAQIMENNQPVSEYKMENGKWTKQDSGNNAQQQQPPLPQPQTNQANDTTRCFVDQPGQSKVNNQGTSPEENMWGQDRVAHFDDPKPVTKMGGYVDPNCVHSQNPASIIGHPPCAEDNLGNLAEYRQSQLNYRLEKANRGVSTEDDFGALNDIGKMDYKAGGVTLDGMSNEAYGKKVAPTAQHQTPRTTGEHQDYSADFKCYVPQNGSSARMQVGEHNGRRTNSCNSPTEDVDVSPACQYTPNANPTDPQSQPNQGVPNNNGCGPDGCGGNQGGGDNGGGGGQPQIPQIPQIPGGGGGQPQNQNQNQNQNPYATPTPGQDIGYQQMSDGAVCPGNYDPVCGSDGITYHNECIATHSQVPTPTPSATTSPSASASPTATAAGFSIAFKGACDGSSTGSNINSQLYGKFTQVIQQLLGTSGLSNLGNLSSLSNLGGLSSLSNLSSALGSSAVPQNLINNIVQALSSIVTKFFSK